jgi:hypothetical protein
VRGGLVPETGTTLPGVNEVGTGEDGGALHHKGPLSGVTPGVGLKKFARFRAACVFIDRQLVFGGTMERGYMLQVSCGLSYAL